MNAIAAAEGGRCNGENLEIEAEAGSQIGPEAPGSWAVQISSAEQPDVAQLSAILSEMELIGDAGHFVMFLQPELFLEKLLAYARPLADTRTAEVASE